jgi:transposase InsO family protein
MDDIARWIELRYNRTRLHSTLGYREGYQKLSSASFSRISI